MTTVTNEGADILNLLIRRLWIIILVAILSGGLSFFLSSQREPLYESQTRILIGNVIDATNPNVGTFDLSQRLALVYLELVLSRENVTATMQALGIDMPYDDFQDLIGATIVQDTPILIVTARYSDPQIAADIANQLAQGLIARAPSNLTQQEENRLTLINQQIDALESRIETTQVQLDDLVRQIEQTQEIQFLNTESLLLQQYNQLSSQIATSQATLAQLLDTYLTLSQRVNSLEILDAAQPIPEEVSISPIIIGIAGAIVGAILAAALVLFLEYTNRVVRSEEDLRAATTLPLLATIAGSRSARANPAKSVVIHEQSGTVLAENFRTLRTGLLYSREWNAGDDALAGPGSTRVISIASPRKNDGSSFVAANLAVSMAETGARILLIDCNIRVPMLHEVFGLPNERGLVTLLLEAKENPAILQDDDTAAFMEAADIQVAEAYSDVHVLTTGTTSNMQHPVLLGFENIEAVIARLAEIGAYQVILMDTSPALEYADAYTVAAKTGAHVLLLTRAKHTTYADVRQLRDQFEDIGVSVTGVVLNKT